MASSWFRLGTISVTNGSTNVTGSGTSWLTAPDAPAKGDSLTLTGDKVYEILAIVSDTQLTLQHSYGESTQSNRSYGIMRVSSGADITRFSAQITAALNQKQQMLDGVDDFMSSTADTATWVDRFGSETTLPTLSKITEDAQAATATAESLTGSILAPTKAEFLARHKGKYPGSGFVHMGKHNSGGAYPPVNQGIWPVPSFSDAIYMGRGTTNIAGISTTNQAQVIVNNILIDIYGLNRTDPDFNPCRLTLPPAPDGLDKRDGSGRFATLADAIAAGGTSLSQSVINRQDLVLLEVWHEKISDKDVVYPRGLVQYYLGEWEGLGLSTTYVDQGYSAMFEGDTSTTGKSRRWSTSSPAEQAKFIQDPLNNIYSDNGELIQVRARARVIRGLEGSWEDTLINERSLHSFVAGTGGLRFSNNNTFVKIQGKLTSAPAPSLGGDLQDIYLDYNNTGATNQPSYGSCSARSINTSEAHNAELRVIPICLVSRLNQGAYHPVFNSRGTSRFWDSSGNTDRDNWNESDAKQALNVSECFDRGSSNGTSGNISPFVYSGDGKIGGQSGRPDGGLYDSIKAGQIKDLRIDASGTHTPVSAHHTLSKRARNGEARGWEKLPRIRSQVDNITTVSTTTGFALKVLRGSVTNLGSWLTTNVQDSSGWFLLAGVKHKIHAAKDDGSHVFLYSHTLPSGGYNTGGTFVQAVFGDYIDAPYSEGLFQNVVGHPSVIASFIASTSLGSIMGEWLPVIPDGTVKEYKGTKKLLEQYPSLYSSDGGVTWGSTGWDFDNADNSQSGTMDNTNDLRIICYKAKANFTEEMAIDSQPFVYADYMTEYNAREAVTWGSVLSQSLHNTIPTGFNSKSAAKIPLTDVQPFDTWETYHTQHSTLAGTVAGSISGSSTSEGTQWEGRLHSQNSLASLVIAYRQIKHDGSSYGAGLAFNYVDNTSNTTDDNGQPIQVGTARSLDDLNIILKENFNA